MPESIPELATTCAAAHAHALLCLYGAAYATQARNDTKTLKATLAPEHRAALLQVSTVERAWSVRLASCRAASDLARRFLNHANLLGEALLARLHGDEGSLPDKESWSLWANELEWTLRTWPGPDRWLGEARGQTLLERMLFVRWGDPSAMFVHGLPGLNAKRRNIIEKRQAARAAANV